MDGYDFVKMNRSCKPPYCGGQFWL